MSLALQDRERKAIEAAIWFANLRSIKSNAQVDRGFRERGFHFEASAGPSGNEDFQAGLQDYLQRVVGSERGRREVAAEVAPILEEMISTTYTLTERRLEVVSHFQDIVAVCAFAVALILDERRGLTSRLQRCVCGRFNLDFDPKGRPRKYCSPKHKARADALTVAERVRKHRSKLTQEKP